MTRYKVVVSDQVFPSVEIERAMLAEIDAELSVATGSIDEVLGVAADADAILNTYLPWNAEAIDRLERCRIIARYGIGVDNVDLDAAAAAGIVVTNVPDYSVEEVATHALALILASLRKVVPADDLVRSGGWTVDNFRPIHRLSTMTVGLVGYGRIARRIAAPLEALGARLVAHDPYLEPGPDLPPLMELDELLSEADVISLHLPLTNETRGLIDAGRIGKMKPGAILVNTSRGPLVDEAALVAALKEGRIVAGLDVFDQEPLPADHPLRSAPNTVMTPHLGYGVREVWAQFYPESVENALAFLDSKAVRVMNPEVLGRH